MKLYGNKILITGGGTGIGYGMAERFLSERNDVIVCGRRLDVLQEAARRLPGLTIRQCDLEKEHERIALFDWIATEHPGLNVLVNNAAVQNWMCVGDEDYYSQGLQEMTINMAAPVHLTSMFLKMPHCSTVINVSSELGFCPLTQVPVYSATKAFLHSYTLSLRHLLQQYGIEVIEIIPPAINTDLGGKGLHDWAPPVSDFIEAAFTQLRAGCNEITFGCSTAVVEGGREALREAFMRLNAYSAGNMHPLPADSGHD